MSNEKLVWIAWLNETVGGHEVGDLIVEGCRVPYVRVRRSPDPATDGEVTLQLDRRYAIDVNEHELNTWGWFVANAMAIAAGYDHHGPTSQPRNLFASVVHDIAISEGNDE